MRRYAEEIIGSGISKKWSKIDKVNITTVDEASLTDVLKIYSQNFPNRSEKKLIRYSQIFPNIFYVIQYNGKSVGYCSYYIQPTLSLRKIKRSAVIFSVAVDRDFSRKGFGEALLRESIKELKVNRIESIWLFVNAENNAAIGLYKKIGFESTDIIENMYGEGKNGCKMRLLLN
ncbi:MAG: GNAT family N-acetyltransferase [Methanomethylovorans sp.]|uniref:GNAT family N-acetyltransferase n=1 Tax=Methanomethylovorans sp. TaxID=2758717 RepID=UPI0035310665